MTSFSLHNKEMFNVHGRLAKAVQIMCVLEKHLGEKKMQEIKFLDVGCSTGIMTDYFSKFMRTGVGVDVDKLAIKFAAKNFGSKKLHFELMDGQEMEFKDNFFDLVIINQVYNCVSDPDKLFSEVFRVLKPGGVSFLGAGNINFVSYRRLRRLVLNFKVTSYTVFLAKFKFKMEFFPSGVLNILEPLSPNFIWILEKPTFQKI